ncbi:MAG: DoxX family protein [Oligoflexales bacterium]|nr:DoxX family protein [Oligoflexales bacterium]
MSVHKQKVIFWVVTAPFVAMMIPSALGMLMQWPQNVEGIGHLGYPVYFMTLLGTAKALGVAALVYRRFRTLTEWAYAGFTFNLIAASYSHYSSGDGLGKAIAPLIILGLVLTSYKLWKRE